ncbi:MAG: trypsin-like serine protease [Nitrospira sp.]|nr:trypsin-like serine protease [Nitrospira sp.]
MADAVQAKDLSPREIYEHVAPAVVMVMGYPASDIRGNGGTGSIIQSDGLVLTNAHVVIEEAKGRPFPRLMVYLKPDRVTGDQRRDLSRGSNAHVVAYSQSLDLALLKMDEVKTPLPVVILSDSETTHIGDHVVAIGHPEQGGLWTLTTGTISAEFDHFKGIPGKQVFQAEAGINRGNSGGPLLNQEGRMVGVNTAIARIAADGMPIASISFSLKSAVAKQWLDQQNVFAMPPTTHAVVPSTTAAAEHPTPTPAPPPFAQPKAGGSASSSPNPATIAPSTPTRPYNLDQLVSEQRRAEADLENMMIEMRGRVKER